MKTKAQTKYFGPGLPSYKVGQQFLKQSVQRAFVDPAHFDRVCFTFGARSGSNLEYKAALADREVLHNKIYPDKLIRGYLMCI